MYDAIASHFSSTRFAIWPKVRAFLEGLAPGSVVADVGCGNGKYLAVRHDLAVLGSDRSAGGWRSCVIWHVCQLMVGVGWGGGGVCVFFGRAGVFRVGGVGESTFIMRTT